LLSGERIYSKKGNKITLSRERVNLIQHFAFLSLDAQRYALYIGVSLGGSIFGHVENAFLRVIFASCYNIEPLVLPWTLDCGVLGFTMQNLRRKYSQRNFWRKYV